MPQVRQRFLWALGITAALLMISLYWGETRAHGIDIDIDNSTTNNYANDGASGHCLTCGMSDDDVSQALSLAMTAGAHELDYSTTDFQLSVTYALQVDDEEEGAYSVKLGKKWDQLPALFHVTYVPEQGQDFGNWVVFGGTVRF